MTATGGAPQQGTEPSGRLPAPVPGMRWLRVFPGHERQLGVMRRWLAALLPDCPARDNVTSVASELGANAVRHTASGQGGWFAVEITWHPSVVLVAVADCGAPDGPRVVDDPDGEHGRGLLVVRNLSTRTGVCGDHRGRLVWAMVPWGSPAGAESVLARDPYEAVICDGEAGLAARFAGVPAWFGRSTLQWWALAGGGLVAAPSVPDLASVLGRVLEPQPPQRPAARGTASADAAAPAARPARQTHAPAGAAPQGRPSRVRVSPAGPGDPGRCGPGRGGLRAVTASD